MENIKTPSFKGCSPYMEEWLDDDTFIIYFTNRNDKITCDDEVIDTLNSLYAEVHLDEDNAVVIGENVYDGICIIGIYNTVIAEEQDKSNNEQQEIMTRTSNHINVCQDDIQE